MPNGQRVMRKRVIGPLETYRTKNAAEKAARVFRMTLLDKGASALTTITIRDLVTHFREQELVDRGEEGRSYSTRDRCESVLTKWILPRWEKTPIDQICTVSSRGVAAIDLARKGNQSQNPEHDERSVQSRDPMGCHIEQSHYRSCARFWRASKRQGGAYPRCS